MAHQCSAGSNAGPFFLLAGASGIAALVAHPVLLDLRPGYRLASIFFLAGALWIGSVLMGLVAMSQTVPDRPPDGTSALLCVGLAVLQPCLRLSVAL